jgi:hypothetical protein
MATPNDSWPNRNLSATVVDTDPPQPSAWPNWAPPAQGHGAWPTKKKLQRHPRRLVNHTDRMAKPAPTPRPVGRWIVAGALWAFAGGLFAGPPVALCVDRGVEVGMGWLAVRAPSFLQPYLPKPMPKPVEPPTPTRGRVAVPPTTDDLSINWTGHQKPSQGLGRRWGEVREFTSRTRGGPRPAP